MNKKENKDEWVEGWVIDDYNIWKDGICKKCGSIVIEMPCEYDPYNKETHTADYQNICSNDKCEEHKFHYVGDQEFLEYYDHE